MANTKKSTTKKKPAAKPAAKKAVPKKKTTKKAAPKKQPVQVEQPLFRKKTIAERTVAFKTRNWASVFGWVTIAVCALLALFLHFCMVGYSFSVLVCLSIIGIILATGIEMILSNLIPDAGFISEHTFDTKAIGLTAALAAILFGSKYLLKKKLSPITLICIAAVLGIVVYGV